MKWWTAVATGLGVVLVSTPAWANATFVIHNLDATGQGFNDTTPFSPVGGNNATTLGQARLNALQAAANIWASNLTSMVPIEIDARWVTTLTCTTTSVALASAGTLAVYQDFLNVPSAHTSYPGALANAIAGEDLNPSQSDLSIQFNVNLGTSGCFPNNPWYYGLDGAGPANSVDLVTNAAHELCHGLGFQTFFDRTTGAKYAYLDDAYLLNLEQYGASPSALSAMTDAQRVTAAISEPNLLWTGSALTAAGLAKLTAGTNHSLVKLYAPNPVQSGSSVSHFSTSLVPSQLMGPAYLGPLHDPGLSVPLLQDVGWSHAKIAAVPAEPGWNIALLGAALGAAALLALRWRLLRVRGGQEG